MYTAITWAKAYGFGNTSMIPFQTTGLAARTT
jgi:hypothetical protein